MLELVPPHGSETVKPLLLPETERSEERKRAEKLRKVPLDSRAVSDVFMLAMGAYTPLDGFMGHDDWRGSCLDMKLTGGVFWPIPITLPVRKDLADSISEEEVTLIDAETGEILAVMRVREKYAVDKASEAEHVYRTIDPKHPGVAKVSESGDVNLAGRVKVLSEGAYPVKYPSLYIRPAESRAMFLEKGWLRVAAFQTRNPMHRSHEHLVKIALEVTDGVFIHQVLGKLKAGDIPAEVRTRAIQAMINNYFRPETVIQAGYPIEMRYAGPREALLHALIRQNFGCSHLIVGRDHAGVGDYYGPFDSHHVFDELWDGALHTRALKIDVTFYCRKCYGMATAKTCPHDPEESYLDLRHAAAQDALDRCGHTARVQPAGSGGDPQGILRKSAIDRSGSGIMIIAQISDTHIALDTPDAEQRLQDFALTIADINALDPGPDVIVHTGDIVHNGQQNEYAEAVATLAKARAPVYVLAGNRDNRANLREAFSACGYLASDSDFVAYTIDDYPVRLIALDTLSSGSNKGDFCSERVRHLIDLTGVETTKPIAVFTHHPPFEVMVGPDRLHFESQDIMSGLDWALQHSGRVVAVFSGHVHRAAAGHVASIPATVMPSIATTLRKGEYPADMRRRPVYHIHRFDPVWGFATETRIVAARWDVLPRRERSSRKRTSRAGIFALSISK